MISKLTYDQIAEMWPIIREGLQEELEFPILGKHKYRESNILESLLSGAMEAWAVYDRDEEHSTIRLYMIVLTSIYTDPCTKNKTLFIFSILWYRDSDKTILLDLKEALVKYARSKNCHTVSSATNRKDLVELAKSMGVNTSFTLLSLDLEAK